MKQEHITHISKQLGISKSTVSKALRHCSGVDSDSRQRILSAAKQYCSAADSSCAIYSILPDTPSFFWKTMLRGLADGTKDHDRIPAGAEDADLFMKCNVYTHMRDEETVLLYLEEAAARNAKVLLIACAMTSKVTKALSDLRAGRLILFLSEYYPLTNAFYVGCDAYRDGAEMGKQLLSMWNAKHPMETGQSAAAENSPLCFYLSFSENPNIDSRLRGFLHTLRTERPAVMQHLCELPLDPQAMRSPKTLPAYLASRLTKTAEMYSDTRPIFLYAPMGLPQLPLAVQKARLQSRTIGFFHDCGYTAAAGDAPFPILLCEQDVYAQGLTAARAAMRYIETGGEHPETKSIYVPSHFFTK